MKGKKYTVKVGELVWHKENFVNFEKVKEETKQAIENYHPLNSSEEGAEAYRERFRNVPIGIKFEGEKVFQII